MTTKIPPNELEPDAPARAAQASANGSASGEATKPITIALPEDVLRKLRVIAIVRESTVSELIADAAAGIVKRELRRVLSKLSDDQA